MAAKKSSHQETSGQQADISPLMQILEKEKELRYLMKEAEEKAEQMIVDARLKAGEVKREAYDETQIRAMYDEEIEKTRKEAEAIKESSREEVEAVKKFGQKRLGQAVDRIINRVLPG